MLDLFQESIKGYNLPFTLLLFVMFVYWIVALFGLVDLEGGSDVDLDMDGDMDGDTAVEGADDVSGGFMHTVFKAVGLSDAPLILILSIFSLMLWGINMMANIVFNPTESAGTASLLLVPAVIVSMGMTRLLVRPLRPVMKLLRGAEPSANTIGEPGVVKSATLDQNFGRVEISFDGKPLLLNAVLSEEFSPLEKGAPVLVVAKREESEIYVVRPL